MLSHPRTTVAITALSAGWIGAGGDGHPRIAHLHAGPGGVDASAAEPGQ
jgi:hypothetical protein